MLTNNNNNRINIQSSQLEKYLPNLQLVQLVADEDSNLTLIKKRTLKKYLRWYIITFIGATEL